MRNRLVFWADKNIIRRRSKEGGRKREKTEESVKKKGRKNLDMNEVFKQNNIPLYTATTDYLYSPIYATS